MIYSFSTYVFHLSYLPSTMTSLEDLTKQLTSSLSSLLGEKIKLYVKYLVDTYCTKDSKESDEILKKSLTYWNEQKFSFTINVNSDTLEKKATKICSAKTKDGNPCKGKCTKDTDLCASHSKKKKSKKAKKAKSSDDEDEDEDEDDCLKCQTLMKSGTRKGEKCGAKSKEKNGLCGRHSKKSSSDDEEKPKKKKKAKSDDDSSDDEGEKPKKSSDDEDEEKPKKKKAKSDDEEKPKKKKTKSDNESEDKPKKKKDDKDEDDIPLGKPKN